MIVNREGAQDKRINSPYTDVKCVFCHCNFSFKEKDIETVVESIPYDSGIKKVFGSIKDYIVYRYVTCPWCKSKMKLKFIIDDLEEEKNAATRH